jgi:hypothetical protein
MLGMEILLKTEKSLLTLDNTCTKCYNKNVKRKKKRGVGYELH